MEQKNNSCDMEHSLRNNRISKYLVNILEDFQTYDLFEKYTWQLYMS